MVFAVVASIMACGGGGASPSLDQACSDLASSQCAQQQTCNPAGYAIAYPDVATCVARTKLTCPLVAAAPGSGFTPASVEACAKALTAASCDEVANNRGPAACQIRGTLPVGTACANDGQCAGADNYCRLSGSCGVCAVRKPVSSITDPAAFGDCASSNGCQDALICSLSRCAAPVAQGGNCDLDHPCQSPYACLSSKCEPTTLDVGAACDPNADACDGTQGLACMGNTCTKLPTASLGGACGLMGNRVTPCTAGLVCDVTMGNYVGMCRTHLADGAACNAQMYIYDQCEPPAACVSGFCNPPDPLSCTTPTDGGPPG